MAVKATCGAQYVMKNVLRTVPGIHVVILACAVQDVTVVGLGKLVTSGVARTVMIMIVTKTAVFV